jgi:phage shock protein PspC (stress-responsive transcriptional regulator)
MSYERKYRSSNSADNCNAKGVLHRTLSKDVVHKKLSGVCAGVARYYKLPRLVVRVAAIGALIIFPVAVGVAYIVAAILLPSKY